MIGLANPEHKEEADGNHYHQGRHRALLQGLGLGPTDRLQPWLAALGRRLGHPAVVLPRAGLSGHRPRPARARTLHPDRRRSRHGPLRRRPGGADRPSRSQGRRHVGHSTGGGEVVHYIARHGESRVAKAVLISAVPPLMVQTNANPGGLPKSVFDDFQAQLAANRSVFYRALPSGPFYGFNRPGVESSEAIIDNWWRQGMMGGAKAHYDGIVAFSQTDFTEDLKKITVPVLVMHGDDDQIVPYADSAPLSAKLLRNGTLKTYKGFPHGMPTTEADTINADLLTFIQA